MNTNLRVRDERGQFISPHDEHAWTMHALRLIEKKVMGWCEPFHIILEALAALAEHQARRVMRLDKPIGVPWMLNKANQLMRIQRVLLKAADDVRQIQRESEAR